MKTLKEFYTSPNTVLKEAAMVASGTEADRHVGKYLQPTQIKSLKYKMAKDSGGARAGEEVTVKKVVSEPLMGGGVRYHAHVKHANGTSVVPINHLMKPIQARNRGLEQEGELARRLTRTGLMQGEQAGFGAGNDFHLIDKRQTKPKKIRGTQGESTQEIQGEHKSDIKTTAFGQITLSRHPKTGKWHIDDKARSNRPEYASHVENATITVNGERKKLLDHLNQTEPEGTSNKSGIYSDDTDASPAHAYMRDHHVDVVHIDSHGTYRAGMSENRNRHRLPLPKLQGTGRFRVRQKTSNPNKRTVQFGIKKLEPSDVHLGNDEHVEALKQLLGHS